MYLKLVPHRHLFSVCSPWARWPRGPSGGQALSSDERGRRPHAHTCTALHGRAGEAPEHREGERRRRRGRATRGVGRSGRAALGPGLQGRAQKSPANLLSVEIRQWRGAMGVSRTQTWDCKLDRLWLQMARKEEKEPRIRSFIQLAYLPSFL